MNFIGVQSHFRSDSTGIKTTVYSVLLTLRGLDRNRNPIHPKPKIDQLTTKLSVIC